MAEDRDPSESYRTPTETPASAALEIPVAPPPAPVSRPPVNDPNDQAKLLQALKDAKPSWMEDGLGVRGNPTVITHTKAKLEWDSEPVFRRPVIEQDEP